MHILVLIAIAVLIVGSLMHHAWNKGKGVPDGQDHPDNPYNGERWGMVVWVFLIISMIIGGCVFGLS